MKSHHDMYLPQRSRADRMEQHLALSHAEAICTEKHLYGTDVAKGGRPSVCWPCQQEAYEFAQSMKRAK